MEAEPIERVIALLKSERSLDVSGYKRSCLNRRIAARQRATAADTLSAYLARLQKDDEELDRLVKHLTINVSSFFRNSPVFDYIRDELLPPLIERNRRRGGVLRFWSAGCATGEEPYTLALMLLAKLGGRLDNVRVSIYATDIDDASLAIARRGEYPAKHVETLSPKLRDMFDTPVDNTIRMSKHVRNMIMFRKHDLVRDPPLPKIDLLLCRNVLIYLAPQLQQRLLEQFHGSLRPGGFLVLGMTENVLGPASGRFERVERRLRVYRRPIRRAAPPSFFASRDRDQKTGGR